MKILIYTLNYAPEITGIAKYNTEMCEWLCSQGHDVRVITANPSYPRWKLFPGYKAFKYSRKYLSDVHVTYCPLWIPKKPTAIQRLAHLFSYAISSFLVLIHQLCWQPQIIFITEPTLFCLPGAIFFSKLVNAKLILHIQDFEIEAAFKLQIIKPRLIYKLINTLEFLLIRQCDVVSSISQKMCEKILLRNIVPNKIRLFPNWANLELIKHYSTFDPNRIREVLSIKPDAIVCLYSGTINLKQGIEVIISAADKMRNIPNIVFVICGDGPYKNYLEKITKAKNLTNIKWLPLQPANMLNELLGCANIHILPQKKEVADLVLPSKLTNMLASGKPIIAMAERGTQISTMVKGSGIVINPEDTDALACAIIYLAYNPTQRIYFGNKARHNAKTYLDKNTVLSKFWHSVL